MTRNSKAVTFDNHTGGLNTNSPVTSLEINQSLDLQNLNFLPNGGFEKRRGNSVFNSTAMDSGAAVHGLGYYRQASGSDFLMAIAGTKLFKSEFDGTMDDITGALTITTGQDNIWTYSQMNDLAIFVGGNRATNVPIKWNGTGNGAVLGGTPPVGTFGIQIANRFFIGNTVANPSRIQWSILGNPENWTGTGSGTQDVSTNDGDTLVGAARLGNEHLILFKENSIHDLVVRTLTSGSFPLYRLFNNVGAISPRSIVEVGDLIYFITPEPRLKATNGTQVFDSTNPGPTGINDYIDDIFNGLNKSRLKYSCGIYYPNQHQIMWFLSNGTSTTNNLCLVWDLDRKAWLRHTTGYKMNAVSLMRDRTLYGGAYDGKVYQQDVTDVYNDASETSPGTIDAFWRSGWIDYKTMLNAKTIPNVDVNFVAQTSGTLSFSYGYDFVSDRNTYSFSIQSIGSKWNNFSWDSGKWGIFTDLVKSLILKGNGKYFQYMIRNNNPSERFTFNLLEFPVKDSGQAVLKYG